MPEPDFAARASPRTIYRRLQHAKAHGDHQSAASLRSLLDVRLRQVKAGMWLPLRDGQHHTTKGSP